jgi:hypothetical protein
MPNFDTLSLSSQARPLDDPDNTDALFTAGANTAAQPLSSISQSLHLASITPSRTKSLSPDAGDIRTLPSDLACIGLSSSLGPDNWALKIIKLVAYPELIPCSPLQRREMVPFSLSNRTAPRSFGIGDMESFSRNPSPVTSDESGSDDDGYYSDTTKTGGNLYKRRTKSNRTRTSSSSPPDEDPPPAPQLPFFSYTQTIEGSSLTADVHVLSALFPPNERDMINSSGELDEADRALEARMAGEDDDPLATNALRCLQIDLQKFGLGTSPPKQ